MCAQNQEVFAGDTGSFQKIIGATVFIVYPSATMKYALASLANLATLAIGITIGIMLAPHLEKPASARAEPSQVQPSSGGLGAPTGFTATVVVPEQVQPQMTTGTIGSYLLLAHHVQTDELVVNGLDVVKLEQGELNLMARTLGFNRQDVQNIVDQARTTQLYQVAPQKQPAPANTPQK
jgi:hypothetical protein